LFILRFKNTFPTSDHRLRFDVEKYLWERAEGRPVQQVRREGGILSWVATAFPAVLRAITRRLAAFGFTLFLSLLAARRVVIGSARQIGRPQQLLRLDPKRPKRPELISGQVWVDKFCIEV